MIVTLWSDNELKNNVDRINDALNKVGFNLELQSSDSRPNNTEVLTYSLVNVKELYSQYNHTSLKTEEIYHGELTSAFDLINSFSIERSELDDLKIIYAAYNYESYEGYATVLALKGNKLFEVSAGHCSCYGLEGTWSLEETSLPALLMRNSLDDKIKENLRIVYKDLLLFM